MIELGSRLLLPTLRPSDACDIGDGPLPGFGTAAQPWSCSLVSSGAAACVQAKQARVSEPGMVRQKSEHLAASVALSTEAAADTAAAAVTVQPVPAPRASGRSRPIGFDLKQASKPTRWRRDKARLESLEQRVAEQLGKARELEKEHQRLRLRHVALEHCIASRDWQLDILSRWQGHKLDHALSSTAAMASLTREFVSRASLLMLRLSESCNTLADQTVLARISEAVTDYFREIGAVYVLKPGIQFTLIASHLDVADGGGAPRPDSRHWEQVARKISVTQQQLEETAAAWKQTNEAMGALQVEAGLMCQELAAAIESNNITRLLELANHLNTIVFKQAMIYRGFSFIIFGRIMTPFHLARVMVHSFPYFLDTRNIVLHLLQLNNMNPNT